MPPAVSPWTAGLKGRCPRCGEGRLFAGFLRLEERCDSCGLHLSQYNAADGPAFFAMSFVGVFVGFAALFHLLIWFPLIGIMSLALLRPLKGIMVGLTYKHRAFEAKGDDT